MPGHLIDLDQSGIQLADPLIVDTNLIVTRLLASQRPPHLSDAVRAARFFERLRDQDIVGWMPAIVAQEVFHIALVEGFRRAVPHHQAALKRAYPMRRRFDWNDLYKLRSDVLDVILPDLEQLQQSLRKNHLAILQPDDLTPLPARRRWEDELLRLIGRYRLDTNDAAMLLDAQRAGITSIATLDGDLRRAQLDFDVYTWLWPVPGSSR